METSKPTRSKSFMLSSGTSVGVLRSQSTRRSLSSGTGKSWRMRITHFPSSASEVFPSHLLKMRYIQDLYSEYLVLDPNHKCGEFTRIVDCRQWNNISNMLKKFLDLQIPIDMIDLSGQKECDVEFLSYIINARDLNKTLKVLILKKCDMLREGGLQMLKSFTFLQKLDISLIKNVKDDTLQSIATNMSFLEDLNISFCDSVTDLGLTILAIQSCTHLLRLSCSNNPNISDIGVNEIISKCEDLDYVDFSSCPKLTFIGIVVRAKDAILQYIARKIRVLNIAHCRDIQYYSLVWICTALPYLEVIDLTGIPIVDDYIVQSIAGACRKLEQLHIDGCKDVTDVSLKLLHSFSPDLVELSLSKISSSCDVNFFSILLTKFPKLRRLKLDNNSFIKNEVFSCIANESQEKRKEFHVIYLDISYTGVTSHGVVIAMQAYSQLLELNICGLRNVSDAVLFAMPSCCPNMKKLIMSGCRSLSDAGIQAICKHLKHLLVLHLVYELIDAKYPSGEQFTDLTLESIFIDAKHLREVHLGNQLAITMSSKPLLRWFKKNQNHSLQSINFAGCSNLSPEYVQPIFSRCSAINHVTLPDKFITMTTATSSAFWYECFKHTVYTHSYDNKEISIQAERIKKAQEVQVSTKKGLFGGQAVLVKPTKRMVGYEILRPLSNKWALEYRDQYVRRRLLERHAVYLIRFAWICHRVWNKFKNDIMSRRITKCIRNYVKLKEHLRAIEEFRTNRAARCIQRYVRYVYLRFDRAAGVIKRAFIRWRNKKRRKFLKHQIAKIILIQKRVRGMQVRLSEKYIITQIYMKLPSFWKEVARLAPPERKRMKQTAVEKYQVSGLISETRDMLGHIKKDIFRGEKLAPKLPIIVHQPFDKSPYVSLSDGRKLCFYSSSSSIFKGEYLDKTSNDRKEKLTRSQLAFLEGRIGETKNEVAKVTAESMNSHLPVHIYSSKFWPPTKEPQLYDPDTDLFNAAVNNFDLAQNSREPLLCELCRSRLRMIGCSTCERGYCFYCAFQFHRNIEKRNHNMVLIEPRTVKVKDVSRSLVYHIDTAQNTMHELKYVIRYLRTAAEAQRLAKEKQMLKEYEQQEEARRLAYLQVQALYKEKVDSATRISLLFRKFKARKIVRDRKLQVRLERLLMRTATIIKGVLKFQVLYRRFEARLWLYKKGFKFRGLQKYQLKNPEKSKKKLIKSEVAGKVLLKKDILERSEVQVYRHSVYCRNVLFHRLEENYSSTLQMLKANVEFWKAEYFRILPKLQSLEALRTKCHEEHRAKQVEVSLLDLSASESMRELRNKEVKVLHMRFEAAQERFENVQNMRWWITQHLRFVYRKLALLPERLNDIAQQIIWIGHENAILSRVKAHCDERVKKLEKMGIELAPPRQWIVDHAIHVTQQLISLDSQQESLLREEIARIEKDFVEITSFDSLLAELMQSLHVSSQVLGERVALDKLSVDLPYGSEEAVSVSERLITLKAKFKHLNLETIDTVKVALQESFDQHDKDNLTKYAFPHDRPDLPVEEMSSIRAVLLDPFSPSAHFKVSDFLRIYFLQPWLASQSVEDIRYEERISAKEIRLGTLTEELKGLELKMQENQRRLSDLAGKVRDLEVDIEANLDPMDGETDIQRENRVTNLEKLQEELKEAVGEQESAINEQKEMELSKAPKQLGIDRINQEIDEIENKLEERQKLRERSSKMFFDAEQALCDQFEKDLDKAMHAIDDSIASLSAGREGCAKVIAIYADADASAAAATGEDADAEEDPESVHMAPSVPNFPGLLTLQSVQSQIRHRVVCSPRLFSWSKAFLRSVFFGADVECLQSHLDSLQQEKTFLAQFKRQRGLYENFLEGYMEELQFVKRQRKFEIDLALRKERLVELRVTRLKSLQEIKEAQLKQEALAAKLKEEAMKNRKSAVAEAAQKTKKAIRATKDKIREMRYNAATALDEEEKRMAKKIKGQGKDAVGVGGRPEAIGALHLTVGMQATDYFKGENDHLDSKGLAHFERLERSLGNQNFLWFQKTFDDTLFISDIQLGHKDPSHELHKDLLKKKYLYFDSDNSNLRVWFRQDSNSLSGVKDVKLSYTEQEEARNTIDGYRRLEPPLSAFDLPEASLWILKIDKSQAAAGVNTNKLLAEVRKARRMIEDDPLNKNLKDFLMRLNDKLKEALERERKMEVTNPLEAAIEFMALEAPDVEAWMDIFEKIDSEKMGRVSIQQVFDFLDEVPTLLGKEIFYSVDACDKSGFMEFGDFVRAVGTYCFFGKEEIVKFAYVFVDPDRTNAVKFDEFEKLVNWINPVEKVRAQRALNVLKLKSGVGGTVSVAEVRKLNDAYPGLFLPLFLLQNKLRKEIMGTDWWYRKLVKYRGVRGKIMQAGQNAKEIVELELQRYREDVTRAERMAQRELDIKAEPSDIRRTLLQARQVLDELS